MPSGSGGRERRLQKYYSLTAKGKDALQELIGFWADYTACVNGFLAAYQQTEGSE